MCASSSRTFALLALESGLGGCTVRQQGNSYCCTKESKFGHSVESVANTIARARRFYQEKDQGMRVRSGYSAWFASVRVCLQ